MAIRAACTCVGIGTEPAAELPAPLSAGHTQAPAEVDRCSPRARLRAGDRRPSVWVDRMSKTVAVEFGGRWFWAYDVSLGVLLLEAIHVAMETPREQRPPRSDAVLEDLRTHVQVGSSFTFMLDADEWDDQQRRYARSIIAGAGRKLRGYKTITSAEAAHRYVIDGRPYFLRGHEQIDGEVVADLAEAIECLIQDQLPPVPATDRHWFFGVEGGPRTL